MNKCSGFSNREMLFSMRTSSTNSMNASQGEERTKLALDECLSQVQPLILTPVALGDRRCMITLRQRTSDFNITHHPPPNKTLFIEGKCCPWCCLQKKKLKLNVSFNKIYQSDEGRRGNYCLHQPVSTRLSPKVARGFCLTEYPLTTIIFLPFFPVNITPMYSEQ